MISRAIIVCGSDMSFAPDCLGTSRWASVLMKKSSLLKIDGCYCMSKPTVKQIFDDWLFEPWKFDNTPNGNGYSMLCSSWTPWALEDFYSVTHHASQGEWYTSSLLNSDFPTVCSEVSPRAYSYEQVTPDKYHR